MGLFGKILAMPVRVANIPARFIEKCVDPDSTRDDDTNILSAPLETLAKSIEEVFEDE